MAKKKKYHKGRQGAKQNVAQQTGLPKTVGAKKGNRKQLRVFGLVVAALGFILYLNTLNHSYVLDDFSVIKDNWLVQQGFDGIPEILKTNYRHGYRPGSGTLYRPLSLVMYAAEWEMFPDKPSASHFVNILLYALLGLVLFKVLRKLFSRYNVLIPFIICLLFIAHPIHTEVVANIKSRDEILSLLFCLVALGLLLRYLQSSKVKHILLALVSYFLAFMSKEGAITFLFIFPLALYFFTETPLKKNIRICALFIIPTAIYLLMRQSVLGEVAELHPGVLDNMLVKADTMTRMGTAVLILGKYLLLLCFPHPLVSDYSYNQIPLTGFGDPWAFISLMVYAGLFIFALIQLKKKTHIAFGILLFLATVSLPSNLFFIIGTNMGERLLFAPSLGFCIVLGFLMVKLFKAEASSENEILKLPLLLKRNAGLFGLLAVVLIAYSFKTYSRNKEWESDLTLYESDVKKSSNSARSHYHYALRIQQDKALKTDNATEKVRFLDMAIEEFEKAIAIYPPYADAWDQMGIAYLRKGDNEKALECFHKALEIDPQKPVTYSNMGKIFFDKGQLNQQKSAKAVGEERKKYESIAIQEYQKALDVYLKAVSYNPRYSDGWMNMGSIYALTGRYKEAIDAYNNCLQYETGNPAMVYKFIGMSYRDMGDAKNAKIYLDKAYQLNPALRD